MQHDIPVVDLGADGESMAEAVSTCIRCGFCLSACPTYAVAGDESDSPRGRIQLMKEVLEGKLRAEEVATHVDSCLGCLACEPACPSGVSYRDLLGPYRAKVQAERSVMNRGLGPRLQQWLAQSTLPYPSRLRLAASTGRWAKRLRRIVPPGMRAMLDLLPDRIPPRVHYDAVYPAVGQRRGRVALLTGCAQSVLAPEINLATIDVLNHAGVEVYVPKSQVCCGALDWHLGNRQRAARFAVANLSAFDGSGTDGDADRLDAVITNAAGCGSGVHEYPMILRSTPHQAAAEQLADKTMDIAVYLERIASHLPLTKPEGISMLAYHDACHLANAQGVRDPPRNLLALIPGLTCVEIPTNQGCCGSAGIYNVVYPETAGELGHRLAMAAVSTGADTICSGNIGCLTQLSHHVRTLEGHRVSRVWHTMQVLQASLKRA
ncbi:MAG: (Fe-S)-binding protein [Planctomycetota bacterium]